MSDQPDLPSRPELPDDDRRPTFNDLRDDYDDNFGRTLTPHEAARRMVLGPAIAFLVIGCLGIVGMIVAAAAVLVTFFDARRPDPLFVLGICLTLLALAGGLFILVIAGGVSMMHLRRRWLALFAAYVVAGLSLAGCYAILFYPFGIWGLIVLYRPDVRREFQRPTRNLRDD